MRLSDSHIVIQTTGGRKNLGSIKWLFPRFFVAKAPLNDTI